MRMKTRAALYVVKMDDANLPDVKRKRIEQWLAQNPAHREAFNAVRATWRFVDEALHTPSLRKPS